MNALKEKGNDVKKVASSADVATVANSAKSETSKNSKLQDKKTEIAKMLTPATAEQRIQNHNIFKKMVEKHEFLTEKADNLNAYMVGRDGMKEKLSIHSDSGMDFEISNSNIIEEILNLCAQRLDEKIFDSKTDILTFEI